MNQSKHITLISYLIVASCFLFCQDPYSKRISEKREKKEEKKNYITGIVFLPYIPKPPEPCKVDCPQYFTNNSGFPFGDYSLSINGQANTAYPITISSTAFSTVVSLATAISERERYYNKYYTAEKKDYSDYQMYERIRDDIENQVYKVGKNTFLTYDNTKQQIEIYSEGILILINPSKPSTIDQSEIYLKLASLTDSELNTALTLNATNTSRYFEITFQGVRYSSKYSGSSISLTLGNVPTASNTALLTITSGTLKSSNSSSLESISISGTMTAYRQ